jgi:hypothetical protein
MELDGLHYKRERERVCAVYSSDFPLQCPRMLVSLTGIPLPVQRIEPTPDKQTFQAPARMCIPSSVQELSRRCFSIRLLAVTFEYGSKLSFFEEAAFSECSSLTSICIPSSIKTLGVSSLSGCRSLLMITFESASIVSCMDNYAFSGSSLSCICIPASVEKIGEGCFASCHSLSVVMFESGSKVSVLDDFAFVGCSLLSWICIPASVEKVGDMCFALCASLSTVIFASNSGVLSIGDDLFQLCTSLSSIWIHPSLEAVLSRYQRILEICVAGDDSPDDAGALEEDENEGETALAQTDL